MLYTTPTSTDITSMKRHVLNVPVISISHPMCIKEIFLNNKPEIKELCNFRYMENIIKPSMLHLQDNQYLISDLPQLQLQCKVEDRTETGCHFCIVFIPCMCAIKAGPFHARPRVQGCEDKGEPNVKKEYPINLPLLLHFQDLSTLTKVHGNSLVEKIPILPLPHIHLFRHNFSKLLAKEHNSDLDLKRVAQAMRDGIPIYQTITELE